MRLALLSFPSVRESDSGTGEGTLFEGEPVRTAESVGGNGLFVTEPGYADGPSAVTLLLLGELDG